MNKRQINTIRGLLQQPSLPPTDPEKLKETILQSKQIMHTHQAGLHIRTKYIDFVIMQLRFIRAKVWAAHLMVVLVTVLATQNFLLFSTLNHLQVLGMVSALTPLLALASAKVLACSFQHGVVELEVSTKYSLDKLLLARMGILGIVDAVFLTIMLSFLSHRFDPEFYVILLYLLVPFVMGLLGCLWIINHTRSRESGILLYIGLLMLTQMTLSFQYDALYAASATDVWIFVLVVSFIGLIWEAHTMLASCRDRNVLNLIYS
ncbi:hypothetical protein [Paenibacillus sp. J22TS3]|uniref:hypothetical protein n=1 Tax=Paenibacillus sp. J22TS3 TaxID=2807192 RepID=UPI001BCB7481|nr:hypothetical protein [Paenibacillus sp. J22TS3]